jgi:crotonobetainyl-CoA:carnitine CoA-transferase CaiB-like acyl-CoA transferase
MGGTLLGTMARPVREEPQQPGAGGPLSDVVVLDLSRVLTGPYASMVLGDLGARVIKVERPGAGDDTREWGPPFVGPEDGRESTYFLSANRDKESVTLDLKDPGDVETLARLVRRADVLIENFRPGVLDRLGLTVGRLHELNPRLVILSITGFGHDGPEASRPGYDQILQGEAGLMSFTGPGPGQPTKVGVAIADILAGMFGAHGVLAALHERERTGRGRVVRTSLLAAVVAVHAFQGTRWLLAGEVPEPMGNRHPTVSPYGAFRCRDGIVQIAVGSNRLWEQFCALVGMDAGDPRFRTNRDRLVNWGELEGEIGRRLEQETLEHWLSAFAQAGIPAGEVKPLDRVYEWEQVHSQGLVLEVDHATLGRIKLPGPAVRFDGGGRREHLAPPTLGQHTEAILRWLDEAEEG